MVLRKSSGEIWWKFFSLRFVSRLCRCSRTTQFKSSLCGALTLKCHLTTRTVVRNKRKSSICGTYWVQVFDKELLNTRFPASGRGAASPGRAMVTPRRTFNGIPEVPTDSAASLCLSAHCFGLQLQSLLVCSRPPAPSVARHKKWPLKKLPARQQSRQPRPIRR